jgi:hypothetical protein
MLALHAFCMVRYFHKVNAFTITGILNPKAKNESNKTL